ncbi:unnamed protein product [Prorocentrum cordatum]|uniref:Uncharacterized protein n=1 Tax=Prorocentrum cordatum TaxID=2364126 RepID=A0ABN9UXN7_9DINO|nr:unnamed protein product [Polarella glacialis]
MAAPATPPGPSLVNFEETNPDAKISSPRSLKACKLEGILPDELIYKPVEAFHERALSPRLVKLRYDFFEAKRRDLLAAARRQRDTLVAEERRQQEVGSRSLDLIAQEKGVSRSSILAVNSDGLRQEQAKMRRAQDRERAWLKSALNNELAQLKELEHKDLAYSETANEAQERQREAAKRMKAMADKKAQEEERPASLVGRELRSVPRGPVADYERLRPDEVDRVANTPVTISRATSFGECPLNPAAYEAGEAACSLHALEGEEPLLAAEASG